MGQTEIGDPYIDKSNNYCREEVAYSSEGLKLIAEGQVKSLESKFRNNS